jgi:hypothetical protein
MKHKDIEKLIQKSLDFETNAEDEKRLHLHLSDCEECQGFYQELVQTRQALDRLIEFYPRHGFNDRVLRKLGFKRVFAWGKPALVLAGLWLASILAFILSPIPKNLLNRILFSTPALLRLVDNARLIISSMSQMLEPLAKVSINSSFLIFGLIFSIILFYFFGKIINPVRNLGNDIKPSSKGRFFNGVK